MHRRKVAQYSASTSLPVMSNSSEIYQYARNLIVTQIRLGGKSCASVLCCRQEGFKWMNFLYLKSGWVREGKVIMIPWNHSWELGVLHSRRASMRSSIPAWHFTWTGQIPRTCSMIFFNIHGFLGKLYIQGPLEVESLQTTVLSDRKPNPTVSDACFYRWGCGERDTCYVTMTIQVPNVMQSKDCTPAKVNSTTRGGKRECGCKYTYSFCKVTLFASTLKRRGTILWKQKSYWGYFTNTPFLKRICDWGGIH